MKIIPPEQFQAASFKEHFTGEVFMETLEPPSATKPAVLRVTFPPAARTDWHTHPAGQTLVILSGICRVQKRGEAVEEVTAGGVVLIGAGKEHWHGAAPESLMQHLAIQAGETVWQEAVTEAEYGRR